MPHDPVSQSTTAEALLANPQFRQCAWCRRRLDAKSDPIGEPLPALALEASHGICSACLPTCFPDEAPAVLGQP